jgi:hypothetical protein
MFCNAERWGKGEQAPADAGRASHEGIGCADDPGLLAAGAWAQ